MTLSTFKLLSDPVTTLLALIPPLPSAVFYAPPQKKMGEATGFRRMSTISPAQMGGLAPPPPHFGAEKPKWGGGGKKYTNARKRALLTYFARSFL